jgi:nitroreductase
VRLDECIRSRRSIRRYQPREVPDALVFEILDLARHAPSSMDGQPCCFVVVRRGETKRRLAETKDAHCPLHKRAAYPAGFLGAAPVVVAVCVERDRAHGRDRENAILATAFLLLAAHARGLSGVYLSAYQKDGPGLALEIGRLLDLPPEVEPVTLVPLGYPAEDAPPKMMRSITTLVHQETFDGRAATQSGGPSS